MDRARTDLWGAETTRDLGATFLPRLVDGQVWVEPAEVDRFARECVMLAEHAPLLSRVSGFAEEYIRQLLHGMCRVAAQAVEVGGGVVLR